MLYYHLPHDLQFKNSKASLYFIAKTAFSAPANFCFYKHCKVIWLLWVSVCFKNNNNNNKIAVTDTPADIFLCNVFHQLSDLLTKLFIVWCGEDTTWKKFILEFIIKVFFLSPPSGFVMPVWHCLLAESENFRQVTSLEGLCLYICLSTWKFII